MLLLLSLLTAVVAGLLVLLLIGPVPAGAVALLVLAVGISGARAGGAARRASGLALLVVLLLSGSYGAILAIDIVEAVTTTAGPVDPADAGQLAAAEDKLEGLEDASSFRLELTEPELQAVIQDGLAAAGEESPVRSVTVDLRRATADVAFTARFKAEDVEASGVATVAVVDGGVELDLGPLSFGAVEVPGVAAGAIEQLLGAVTDLNAALAEQRAAVQHIEVTDTSLVVVGTRATTEVLTDDALLDAIREQALTAVEAVQAPPERIGRGRLAGPDDAGSPIVLAIGDSLAANVGVEDPRDGFVSRVHAHLEQVDGRQYGLVNVAVPGETSGTLLSSGQLAQAEAVLASRPAAYVLVDIGANDLLGHLTSPECGADLTSPACQDLVARTLESYRTNLARVLDRVLAAAGDADVRFLQTYNPFSLGLGDSPQETASTDIVSRLNAVAAEVAAARGVAVADGFTAMLDTAAATTHMLDPEPDVHPNAAGHDVLAAAIADAG